MGEGEGGGEKQLYFGEYLPPPLNPLPPGEGKSDFLRGYQTRVVTPEIKIERQASNG